MIWDRRMTHNTGGKGSAIKGCVVSMLLLRAGVSPTQELRALYLGHGGHLVT